ncbi:MAG TPA: DbpA RNA binding domain-containing protein, partial [Thermoanaerobaculia bacterium]|nr:DbpA RNA binding domain-containing protein [Thermoanaerobaculia bacterium]
ERFTGTQIKPMKMPTAADVAARRITTLKETLRKELKEGDLDLYVEVVTQLAEEGPFDMADVAAAAARIANVARPIAVAEVPVVAAPPPPPARSVRAPADREEKVRLSMAVGKRDGVRPADIVGSIANEADVPGRDIGPIDIRDDITYVSVPERYRDQVLERVGRAKFRGRSVNIKVAEGGYEPRPRPAAREGFAPRREGPPRYEKREYPKREGAPRYEKREGPPRFAPKRDDRPRDDKRPFGARPGGERPFGAKSKPFGAKGKPFAGGKGKPFAGPKGKPKPKR